MQNSGRQLVGSRTRVSVFGLHQRSKEFSVIASRRIEIPEKM